MHSLLLLTHSVFRYFVLLILIVFVIRTLMGWLNKSDFKSLDDRLGIWLFMVTHTQLVLGLILYFISPQVVFGGESMKDSQLRYWLVEHGTLMLLAIILITVARISSKKLTDAVGKYRRLFIYNFIALVLILLSIQMSGRGFLGLPAY